MGISIEATVSAKLGLASHQNAVPLLRQIALRNDTDAPLEDVSLECAPNLAFAVPRSWHIDRVEAGGLSGPPECEIALNEGFLADLSESMQTSIALRVRTGDAILAERRVSVELLARNQWGGAGSMPELLAVFCTPNDPAVDKVLKHASDVLRRAGRPDGIDGYNAGRRQRSWELVSAIWSAVCAYQISYAVPPASFEQNGQKVRTPSQIADGRVATCLDTALLFGAAVEQAGLNPLVVLTRGHAFAGAWLQPEQFAHVLTDDASVVRKRVELQELVVFETTLATQSPAPSFSQAVGAARSELTDQDFLMAIDIRRARMQKLRPLSVTVRAPANASDGESPKVSESLEAAPDLPAFDVEPLEAAPTAVDKLETWRRRLLDLTTRNRLLHLPDSAKVVRLFCPNPDGLEDILADGKSVRIVPMPELEVGGRDRTVYRQRTREDLEGEAARQALTQREVISKLEKPKLDALLIDLYRKAKSDLEEGGSNTLFLAVGFLRWKKTRDDPKGYYAPLILLPVKLERHSVISGVKMAALDEEPRFNLTLLELLRQDFQLDVHGLDGELPTDASGIDVEGIWNTMRRAVRDMPGFEVVSDVVLGTFSFAKYLMWRDLADRTDELAQNDVVQRLLRRSANTSSPAPETDFPKSYQLDATIDPRELFVPLPVDSSQLTAVIASAQGKSFVLDGPPGTGKSQTIANIIAHNLALGRRVLFVAEKMAALDVVKRRLEERGIGEFCLELHSSKSSKVHVLQQLDRAWTSRGEITQADWSERADKVRALREELNTFVGALHKRWPNGWSVYDAIGRVVRDKTAATPRLTFAPGTSHDAAQMQGLRDVARRLDLTRAATAGAAAVMTLVTQTEWSNAWQADMVRAARAVLAALSACDHACEQVVQRTCLTIDAPQAHAAPLVQLVQHLPDAYGIDLRFAFSPELKNIRTAARDATALLTEYRALEHRLSRQYAPESVRRIDVDQLRDNWAEASGKFWLLTSLAKRKVAKTLGQTAATSEAPDVTTDLPLLIAMKAVVAKLDALDASLHGVPGWSRLASNLTELSVATKLADALQAALTALAVSPENLVALRHQLEKLVVDGNDILVPSGQLVATIRELGTCHQSLIAATTAFGGRAGSDVDLTTQVQDLRVTARAIVENEHALNAWCSWQRVRKEAIARGLRPLVDAVECGSVSDTSVADVFETAYAHWFAAAAIDAEPVLRQFVAAEYESDVVTYSVAVDKLTELTAKYIRAKLSGEIPNKNGVTQRSGFGILKHELQKQRRHKAVRKLVEEMGPDFSVLAPCMLMSPLSIAQYLPADHELFDLVIFDEASQIAPWDAVGSIARGKQAIIAGDPKQMPPTTFFDRGTSSGDNDTDEDLESILDECIGAGIPEHSLTWHYRSHHESLITFSNYEYYGGKLVTFPAADTRPSAVSWRKVDGVYAPAGGGRVNQAEAKAIVAEVMRRLTDRAFVQSGQSIGIITLNAEQQRLVDDLLDQARREHPEIEAFFRGDRIEPVIVKNLETMQGDERDLILLGVGYGPTMRDAKVMSMNFGPLNREGGWRRLNVAVTRARREMVVFTSFDPSLIDLGRTSARAVKDLRHFIEYAHAGPIALTSAVQGSVGGYESPFEEFVAEGLQQKGWEVRPQIGVSRFRIDLGIVHPERPGDYLVGIECDGASYHSAATARDRDKVRSEILRGLGWNLLRVWSTEWWVDRDGALDRLDAAVRAELERSRVADKAKCTSGVDICPEAEIPHPAPVPTQNGPEPKLVVTMPASADAKRLDGSSDAMVSPGQQLVARGPTGAMASPVGLIYTQADLSCFVRVLRPDEFNKTTYNQTLQVLIQCVLAAEAPISDRVLVDRIARIHGFKRSGRIIRERVLNVAAKQYHFEADPPPDGETFVWLTADDPGHWNAYRIPADGTHVRSIEEIARPEIRAAARAVDGPDTAVEVARLFHIQRLSAASRDRIERAIRDVPDL